MKSFISTVGLGMDDIAAKVNTYQDSVIKSHWIHITNRECNDDLSGLLILASEQQLKALLEALRKWDEERVVNVPPNISQLPVNGPLVKS